MDQSFLLSIFSNLILRIVWTHLGYNLGTKSIDITENSDTIANAATILGITVIGALICFYVSINLLPVIEEVDGGIKVAVQTEFFDKIFPNFLPMCVTLLCFWLLKKKQVSPIVLIVAIIVLSIVASAVGLL